MICPYCGKEAVFVSNKEIYGRKYGKSHMIWYCKLDDAYVSVHDNDPERPKGTMAKNILRLLRIDAHKVFDPIWKNNENITRRYAYYLLAKELNLNEVHIGEANEKMCIKIINAAKIIKKRIENGEELLSNNR